MAQLLHRFNARFGALLDRHNLLRPGGRLAWLSWLRRLGWEEVVLLLAVLFVVVAVNGFLELADDVGEGDTQAMDERIIRAFRRADDPAMPIGPPWLERAALDVTALGSHVVALMATAATLGFLLIQRRYRMALLVTAAIAGGMALNTGLKHFFMRERPTVVPHLHEVFSPSFPSGHSAMAAVVYLTLGALLMSVVKGHVSRLYCLVIAMVLTGLIGLTRVYLGVHYPTDVLAGWTVGLVWALLCYIVSRLLQIWGALRERRRRGNIVEDRWEDDAAEDVVLKI